jgi:transcriptional regulator
MRYSPKLLLTDPNEVKRLIRENPWATIVSNTATGLIASHYPVILEENEEGISIVSHVGRPDDELHELGQHEMLVIIQGPHGYISPGWYGGIPAAPTWNHVTAHLYGTPELLEQEENYQVLGNLVDYFEDRMPHPNRLADNEKYARRVFKGTAGFRLRVTRFDARLKLSQDKPREVAERVIVQLETSENYRNPRLAKEMRRIYPES